MGFSIFDLLLPRETKFYKYMDQQAEVLVDGAVAFKSMLKQLEDLSEDEIRKKLWYIGDCETRGDAIEAKVLEELSRTFITPIDREDIHDICLSLDKAMDVIFNLSKKIDIYHIRKVPSNVCKFADIIVQISQELREVLKLFAEKKANYGHLDKMHKIETKGDELFHESMADLFGKETNPVKLIKLKEVYEHLENAVNAVDYVGKLIRGVIVKQG